MYSPPHNFPITPNNTYLILKEKKYIFKRFPKHWYEKVKSAFKSVEIKFCLNSPCLFTGIIIKNKPPLYLVLYIDDFIYFSKSPEVQRYLKIN